MSSAPVAATVTTTSQYAAGTSGPPPLLSGATKAATMSRTSPAIRVSPASKSRRVRPGADAASAAISPTSGLWPAVTAGRRLCSSSIAMMDDPPAFEIPTACGTRDSSAPHAPRRRFCQTSMRLPLGILGGRPSTAVGRPTNSSSWGQADGFVGRLGEHLQQSTLRTEMLRQGAGVSSAGTRRRPIGRLRYRSVGRRR